MDQTSREGRFSISVEVFTKYWRVGEILGVDSFN